MTRPRFSRPASRGARSAKSSTSRRDACSGSREKETNDDNEATRTCRRRPAGRRTTARNRRAGGRTGPDHDPHGEPRLGWRRNDGRPDERPDGRRNDDARVVRADGRHPRPDGRERRRELRADGCHACSASPDPLTLPTPRAPATVGALVPHSQRQLTGLSALRVRVTAMNARRALAISIVAIIVVIAGCSSSAPSASGPASSSASPSGQLTRTSDGGQVTVVVDWAGPSAGAVFHVTLDTHAVDLDPLDLTDAVLRN